MDFVVTLQVVIVVCLALTAGEQPQPRLVDTIYSTTATVLQLSRILPSSVKHDTHRVRCVTFIANLCRTEVCDECNRVCPYNHTPTPYLNNTLPVITFVPAALFSPLPHQRKHSVMSPIIVLPPFAITSSITVLLYRGTVRAILPCPIHPQAQCNT